MPRRAEIQPRSVAPDPVYGSVLVTQLVNRLMSDGKKSIAERVVYDALTQVADKSGKPALEALEADTFWCLSKLLDGIQDNYIFAQPGIQRQVRRMEKLVARIDRESSVRHSQDTRADAPTAPLHAHLQDQGVEYMQFAFRWMNCLLMRELSVQNIVRMWDTYLVRTSALQLRAFR